MKWNIVALVLALGIIATIAFHLESSDSPGGKTVMNLTWDSPFAVKIPSGTMTVTLNSRTSATFTRTSSAQADHNVLFPVQTDLFRIPNPPVQWDYVITGLASYENLPDHSELQLTACYLGNNAVFDMDTNSANSGANKGFYGTSGLRRFVIPVRLSPSYFGTLLQLDVSLFIARDTQTPPLPVGAVEKLTLSDLKLVRYPDPPADSTTPAPPTPSASDLDWKSFLIGTAATAILCLAIAQGFVLVRRLRKLRADREIRQMSSLDASGAEHRNT